MLPRRLFHRLPNATSRSWQHIGLVIVHGSIDGNCGHSSCCRRFTTRSVTLHLIIIGKARCRRHRRWSPKWGCRIIVRRSTTRSRCIIIEQLSQLSIRVTGQETCIHKEGGCPMPRVVQLPVSVRTIPLISDHQSLRAWSTTSHMCDTFTREQVHGDLVVQVVRHEELLSGQVVDPCPSPPIFTCLPSIFHRFGRLIHHLMVQLFCFILRRNLFTLPLVGLRQVDVVRHSAIADFHQSQLRSVDGVHGSGLVILRVHGWSPKPVWQAI